MGTGVEHQLRFIVSGEDGGSRLDQFLTKSVAHYSRTFCQQLIEDHFVSVNGTVQTKSGVRVLPTQEVVITIPAPNPIRVLNKQNVEQLGIEVIAEHPDFLVVYKPAGVLVHAPHPDSPDVTLVDWIEYYYQDITSVGLRDRPGIVHRLDKDTSGLLIVARTNYAHMQFNKLFKDRAINKTYHALVQGHPTDQGAMTFSIDRHPVHRHKMTHSLSSGRQAHTLYQVLHYLQNAAYLQVHPITGRTHQIRVHCAAMGHPIIGDVLYGKKSPLIARQALHAYSIAFSYDGKSYAFSKQVPSDFLMAVNQLTLPVQTADDDAYPSVYEEQ